MLIGKAANSPLGLYIYSIVSAGCDSNQQDIVPDDPDVPLHFLHIE
jgi:hypothetical protein